MWKFLPRCVSAELTGVFALKNNGGYLQWKKIFFLTGNSGQKKKILWGKIHFWKHSGRSVDRSLFRSDSAAIPFRRQVIKKCTSELIDWLIDWQLLMAVQKAGRLSTFLQSCHKSPQTTLNALFHFESNGIGIILFWCPRVAMGVFDNYCGNQWNFHRQKKFFE